MRINNNITALNAHRQYGINNGNIAKSVEKLSSGYRINRAGDDAAGLAISEKMRAQIRGLNMASKNSQDAISLVQTAEGALQETHNILQRMRELSVQSASDTNETSIDRNALNKEFQQLKKEIDDIANKTKFNDQALIDGTFQAAKKSIGSATTIGGFTALVDRANAGNYAFTVASVAAVAASTNAGAAATAANVTVTGTAATSSLAGTTISFVGENSAVHNGMKYTFDISGSDVKSMNVALLDSNGNKVSELQNVDFSQGWTAGVKDLKFEGIGTFTITSDAGAVIDNTSLNVAGVKALTGTNVQFGSTGVNPSYTPAQPGGVKLTLGSESVTVRVGDTSAYFAGSKIQLSFDKITDTDVTTPSGKFTGNLLSVNQSSGQTMVIQSGANQGDELSINIDAMNTSMLGVSFSKIASRNDASKAITEVNSAINQVSTQRSDLGALQNRLSHKISNLDTSAENLQAAESRIRDVDMAKEMTNFTRNNILSQASTAMLAQANALPQGVLQLLG